MRSVLSVLTSTTTTPMPTPSPFLLRSQGSTNVPDGVESIATFNTLNGLFYIDGAAAVYFDSANDIAAVSYCVPDGQRRHAQHRPESESWLFRRDCAGRHWRMSFVYGIRLEQRGRI